jgi:asparagine synthase (glutamine-hydrolysing)
MCGICGYIDFRWRSEEGLLKKMITTLTHRGPDDNGHKICQFEQALVGIGHSRLAVPDLTDAGHQPMQFKHLIISYNGEIYNFKEIKVD